MQPNQRELKFPAKVISVYIIVLCRVPRLSLDVVDIHYTVS